jgi:mycothiol synthase
VTELELELRPFDAGRDFPPVVELISAANANARFDWFPSVAGLTVDWAPSPSFDPTRDAIVAERDGRFVGVARTSWRERESAAVHRVEVWVHPDAQRQGIGRALLAWGEGRARAVAGDASAHLAELPRRFSGVTDQANAAGVAFAAVSGYTPFRFHSEMRRDLAEPIPGAALPAGLEVRAVKPEHHRAIWLADAEAFRDHWDASVVHEEDFVRFFAHPDIDTSLWHVAWDGDEIAGMVINGINRDENARIGLDIGWLDDVSTRRPWRGRGVASALIARSLATLRERGMKVAALSVDTENPTGALGVYERFGFRTIRTWTFFRKPF